MVTTVQNSDKLARFGLQNKERQMSKKELEIGVMEL